MKTIWVLILCVAGAFAQTKLDWVQINPRANKFSSPSAPAWATYSGVNTYMQFDIGGYPNNLQYGMGTAPIAQSLVGSVNTTGTGNVNPGSPTLVSGVSGYVRTTRQDAAGVGMFGLGTCSGGLTQCWGANFATQHDSEGMAGGNMVGLEVDINHSPSSAGLRAAIAKGITSVINNATNPYGYSHAYEAIRAATSSTSWDGGFWSNDGAVSGIGLYLGTKVTGGASESQDIHFHGNDGATGTDGVMKLSSAGNLIIQPAASQSVVLEDGSGNTIFRTIPTVGAKAEGAIGSLAGTYSTLPTCGPTNEGLMKAVTDAAVNAWGDSIVAGGGANHVLAYCNGSGWTVAAK